MNGYLLDTNVISLLAPGRHEVSPHFVEWMVREADSNRIFISVITVSEIRRAIAKLRRKGEEKRALVLEGWLEQLVALFSDCILTVDLKVSLLAGEMKDAADAKGRNPGFADILIAACASAHGLTVVTLNLKHFEPLGVETQRPVGSV